MTEEELETLREEVESYVESAIDDLANASAAQVWSTPTDDDIAKYTDDDGEGLLIVAEFGDWMAVNGDLVWSKAHNAKPGDGGNWQDIDLDGYEEADPQPGGDIPCDEQEVWIDHVVRHVINDLNRELAEGARKYDRFEPMIDVMVRDVIVKRDSSEEKPRQCTYTSVRGEATYFVKIKKEVSDGKRVETE